MGTNCFNLDAEVVVCVDGPVGGGNTANLDVFVQSGDFNADDPVGSTSNWDGSTVTYTGWLSSFDGCSPVSSMLTVTLVSTNEVEVTIQMVVNSCSTASDVYAACGDAGPHTFTDSRTVTMTGTPCI